jgi:hypothetical protein
MDERYRVEPSQAVARKLKRAQILLAADSGTRDVVSLI